MHILAIVDTSKRHHATGKVVCKPECVDSYKKIMDKTDMLISLMECTRKHANGIENSFFGLLDLCLYNAFVLYKVNTNNSRMHLLIFVQMLQSNC